MKIVEINSTNYGSTGKIMNQIAATCRLNNIEVYTCVPYCNSNIKNQYENQIFIGNRMCRNISLQLGTITGMSGMFSHISTKKMLDEIDNIKPDIIHFHNLHNCYVNIPMLFKYIKKNNIKVVWTLHDCWPFTGHCPYFTLENCGKWVQGCNRCPLYKAYPKSLTDNSKFMWNLKRKWFSGVENMVIVTPSRWLCGLVQQSFLGGYPVKVINNGIDLDTFKPSDNDMKPYYNIPKDKYVLLGVAFGWGKRKGLDVFIELSKRLDAAKYQIVLVGTDKNIDKLLPDNIISIHRTQNQQELADIYSMADLFVNPTREDNFPTVNMEAIACGTPVVTFQTGGSPEMLDESCGSVVDCENTDAMLGEIIRICEEKPYSQDACVKRAGKFDMNDKFLEYVNLYKKQSGHGSRPAGGMERRTGK